MFERYSLTACRTLVHARERAIQSGSAFIEPLHLLLGILEADPQLLRKLESDSQCLQRSLQQQHSFNLESAIQSDPPLSPSCKEILIHSAHAAEPDPVPIITAAHLLLSLSYDLDLAKLHVNSRGETLETLRPVISALCKEQTTETSQPAESALPAVNDFLLKRRIRRIGTPIRRPHLA